MNLKFRKLFVLLAVSAMLVGGSALVAANAQNSEGQLGKDVASTFREVVTTHQGDIEDFILETKVDVAATNEEKLDVIDYYVNDTLRAKIDEVNSARQDLIAAFQAGEIDNETFTMEMKALALSLATTAKTMGEIGEKLSELGQNLAEDLKARADQLVANLQAFAEEIASIGKAIADEMMNQGLPIPEIPETPNIPDLPALPETPAAP